MSALSEVLNNFLSEEAINRVFFGNTVGDFIVSAVAFVVFLVVLKLVQWVVIRYLNKPAERTETRVDDTLINVIKTIKFPFYSFLAFYASVAFFLSLSTAATRAINIVLIVFVVYQAIAALQVLVDYIAHKALGADGDEDATVIAGLVGKIAKVALWTMGLLLILSNLGINVNSLIAGLGVGGIAIAFALQNILTDLFSSFAIYFDRPFRVGDFIVVGQDKGVVERIGIKTTRIRSLGGEELVISNKELTSARVQNFKQMSERRIVFAFGVLYETDSGALRKIPGIVGEIIKDIKDIRLDRAHFSSFGDSSLDFEVVYYVESSSYNDYMNAQEEINVKILEKFSEEGIEMAYPTRTVYIAGDDESKKKA